MTNAVMDQAARLVDALEDRGMRAGWVTDQRVVIVLGRTKQTTVWLPRRTDVPALDEQYVWLVDGVRHECPDWAVERVAMSIVWTLK